MAQSNQLKSRTASLLTGILILAIGVILIICNKLITGHGIIVVAGILFLLTGIINIVLYVTRKDGEGKKINRGFPLFFGWIVSVAAIILGLCMLVFNSTFAGMIPFIFGLLIFFGAALLILTMSVGVRKVVKLPLWLWIFPVAMIIIGIITITRNAVKDDPTIMILTGVSMLIFGLTGMIVGAMLEGIRHQSAAAVPENETVVPESETKDVKGIEVGQDNSKMLE